MCRPFVFAKASRPLCGVCMHGVWFEGVSGSRIPAPCAKPGSAPPCQRFSGGHCMLRPLLASGRCSCYLSCFSTRRTLGWNTGGRPHLTNCNTHAAWDD
eukprot:356123-Chlamydomonas_euryale.AAC.14